MRPLVLTVIVWASSAMADDMVDYTTDPDYQPGGVVHDSKLPVDSVLRQVGVEERVREGLTYKESPAECKQECELDYGPEFDVDVAAVCENVCNGN